MWLEDPGQIGDHANIDLIALDDALGVLERLGWLRFDSSRDPWCARRAQLWLFRRGIEHCMAGKVFRAGNRRSDVASTRKYGVDSPSSPRSPAKFQLPGAAKQ